VPASFKIVLLPGMDGTGRLFAPLLRQLPVSLVPLVVSYPTDAVTDTDALVAIVERLLPSDEPFALVAESFSGPIAIKVAARAPPELKAVILVASFIRCPARRLLSNAGVFAQLLFSLALPEFAVRHFLVGNDAPHNLVREVSEVVHSVRPAVMAARLRQVLSQDVTAEVLRCPAPMLYIAGKRDRLVCPRAEAILRAVRPDLTTSLLDAPHLVLQTRPAEAGRCIEEFLLGTPLSAPS
jgi:pimeloyl-[acyl-carrier protein] methyl ester esterase